MIGLCIALDKGLRWFLNALMILLLSVMTLQIVMRYAFNDSLIWAEEISRYALVWLAFLAVGAAYRRGEIAALTLLPDALPRRAGLVLRLLARGLGAALCFTLVWQGLRYAALGGTQPIPALRFLFEDLFGAAAPAVPTVWWVYAVLPLGMALMGLAILAEAWGDLRRLLRGQQGAEVDAP